MFTGMIEELGTVNTLLRKGDAAQLEIISSICCSDSRPGDSISVNGCCLTVVRRHDNRLIFDISHETLRASNLADLAKSDKVNLERALAQGGRLGGHFVSGHIDYAGRVLSKSVSADFVELSIQTAEGFRGFIVSKGSVAIDGVSLTVNSISDNSFKVMLIPRTLSCTTLQYKDKGSRVNVETDILAKYVYSLSGKNTGKHTSRTNISKDFLSEHGFV
jgi:riboflavin synthase